MARLARIVVLAFSAIMLGGLIPQAADAQVVVRIGHRHHYHHYYYRHGHRYYR
jgi:hypothetical protein